MRDAHEVLADGLLLSSIKFRRIVEFAYGSLDGERNNSELYFLQFLNEELERVSDLNENPFICINSINIYVKRWMAYTIGVFLQGKSLSLEDKSMWLKFAKQIKV